MCVCVLVHFTYSVHKGDHLNTNNFQKRGHIHSHQYRKIHNRKARNRALSFFFVSTLYTGKVHQMKYAQKLPSIFLLDIYIRVCVCVRASLSLSLNMIIVRLNSPEQNALTPIVLLPRLMQPTTQQEFTMFINLILAVSFLFAPIVSWVLFSIKSAGVLRSSFLSG